LYQQYLEKQRDFSTYFPKPLVDMVHTGIMLTVAPLAKRAQTMFAKCIKSHDAFGPTGSGTAVTHTGEAWVKLITDLHAASGAYPERVVDSPNGDSSSSPWLLKTKGVGEQHTDIAKRDPSDRRGRAGDYRDAASLFVCLSGSGEFTIYNSTDPAGDIETCSVVTKIAFTRGAWVTFPSRLLHRVVGKPRFVLNCILMPRAPA
jgi:hypothetical protein